MYELISWAVAALIAICLLVYWIGLLISAVKLKCSNLEKAIWIIVIIFGPIIGWIIYYYVKKPKTILGKLALWLLLAIIILIVIYVVLATVFPEPRVIIK